MNLDFAQALLLLGGLLAAAAALSGWLNASVLSISVLAVVAGIVLAALDVVSVEPGSALVRHIVELALIVTLFSDGLLVERELLARHWGPPARALVLAMPLTLALLGAIALVLFPGLTVAECFLLAAVLTPTDPVVTSTVVTAMRVPALVRHTLNLESGLNDGLALPFVLFFLTLAEPGGNAASSAFELLGKVAVGALIGVAVAVVGGRLLRRLPGGGIARNYEGVYSLGLAFFAYGLASATWGNGLIAAFVAGVALGVAEHDITKAFSQFNESISAVLQVSVFFLFGALVVAAGWDHGVLPLIAFVGFALIVARPLAVLASLTGTRLSSPVRVFIAWFGPKGVASMLFALLVLRSQAPHATFVFEIASFTILSSIAAHGLTDTIGTRWIEARLEPARPQAPAG
jgi:NhaP-type Na+/H+ or K+/H+ antiporter